MLPTRFRAGALVLITACCLGAAGCAGPRSAPPPAADSTAAGFPLTITDDAERRVTIARPPRRIISLAPAHTETLYAIGAGDLVVAADRYSDTPPEVRSKAKVQTWPKPSSEALLALRPDLVVTLTEGGDILDPLAELGVVGIKVGPRTLADVLEKILLLGRLCERTPAAEQLVGRMRERMAAVKKGVAGLPAPTVIYEIDGSDPQRPYVVAGGDFMGDVLAAAGGKNLFAHIPRPAAQASLEQVLRLDPEVILVGSAAHARELAARPAWRGIRAVRNRRVLALNGHAFTRAGPRLVDALEEAARLMHPEPAAPFRAGS